MRIALIGCGGRGKGAAENCMQSSPNVQLVALGDLFEDKLKAALTYYTKTKHPSFKATEKTCFAGWDAYKRVMDLKEVDLVLLATPPGFRAFHIEAAVEAGKNVFFEKPVAVDAPGVRRVIAAGEKGRAKKLGMLAGTQYRHQISFIQTIKRIHEGAIGKIRYGRAYYNAGILKPYPRRRTKSDMEWQVRNWAYTDWLSGDQPVEQHLHTIDVTDWVMGARPERCMAVGGRQVRTSSSYGNVWDHFFMDYEYPGGVHVMSMCRQMLGVPGYVGAHFVGTKGTADPYKGEITGENPFKVSEKPDIFKAYVQEHADLIASIRAGSPLNEAAQIAESSLTAIMGREAAYTGEEVSREEMAKSDLMLAPHGDMKDYAFGPLPLRPPPVPGQERK
jgi:predicted dehydrogenase